MAILQTKPRSWISWSTEIYSGEDRLTEIEISLLRSRGHFELEGEGYTIEPEGFLGQRSVLRKGTRVLARAEKPSLLRRRFRITSAGHRLELESRSWTGRRYALVVNGREVGSIDRSGFAGRRLRLEFPDEVPVFVRVYLAYLVLVQAKREAAAASSGG